MNSMDSSVQSNGEHHQKHFAVGVLCKFFPVFLSPVLLFAVHGLTFSCILSSTWVCLVLGHYWPPVAVWYKTNSTPLVQCHST
jgi:hypothetical protein